MRRLLGVLLVLSACTEPFDTATISVTHRDPGVPFEGEQAQLTTGGAVTVRVRPQGRTQYSGTESIRLEALDPGTATAQQTILSDRWTILGHAPGRARFRVYVDEAAIDTFEFLVIDFEGLAR